VSGIKRHLAVDTQGLPHAIDVTTADVNDRDAAILLLLENADTLSAVLKLLVDGGYTGEDFARRVWAVLGATVEIAKRSNMHRFVVIPKRWVVERSFAWLEKCRRLWKNCERHLHTSQQMIVLAFVALLLRRTRSILAARIGDRCTHAANLEADLVSDFSRNIHQL
jgi:transposase